MIESPALGISTPYTRSIQQIHFIGLGGAGMCGIAEVLKNQGYEITGSDLEDSVVIRRLSRLGIRTAIGHDRANLGNADVVVVSSAIPETNVEWLEARERHIPVVSRAEMLGELMRGRFGIAVSGTHGKTTATSFITGIFQAASQDPTFVIGGLLNKEGRHAGLGSGRYLIAEADESDASLLFLYPTLIVITNVDRDHLATYRHDFAKLQDTFVEFVGRLPFYGVVVLCIDDPNTAALIPRLNRQVITYGTSTDADYRGMILNDSSPVWQYRVRRPQGLPDLEIEVPLPGKHNVLNSLAAVAVAGVERIADAHVVRGLREFSGVERRFEVHDLSIRKQQVTLVDDYGHHPTEIDSILNTIRQVWPRRRVFMVYQPHRFSRTRDLFSEFVKSLSEVDELVMVRTYSAGEEPIDGADALDLARAIEDRSGKSVKYVRNAFEAKDCLESAVRGRDVVVVQGAGNVSLVSESLRERQNQGAQA